MAPTFAGVWGAAAGRRAHLWAVPRALPYPFPLPVFVLLLLLPLCPGAGGDDSAAAAARLSVRGGSAAAVAGSAAGSPLRFFIQRTAGAHAAAQAAADAAALAPGAAGHAGADKSGNVDNDGDSLMGQPVAARAGGAGARAAATPAPPPGPVALPAAGAAGPPPRPPGEGAPPVPFQLVCRRLLAALAEDEPRTAQLLADLVSDVWQRWPADLAPLVCLLRDQLLSPTLQGVELLPAAQVLKVVADSLAKTPEGLRDSLNSYGGDLAVAAQRLRGSQRVLFAPPPLTLQHVVASLRNVAERRDAAIRYVGAKQLLVAASGEEAFIIVKALQGSLRLLGFSKGVIVAALAAAAHAHPAPAPAPAQRGGVGDEAEDAESPGTQEELVGVIWQAVSLVADWRKLVPALQSHGPHRALSALNVPLPRQRGTGSRGAKLRALQRSELGDGEGMVVRSPTSAAEEEAQAAREARFAALTFGLRCACV
jgi:DNA ligase-1